MDHWHRSFVISDRHTQNPLDHKKHDGSVSAWHYNIWRWHMVCLLKNIWARASDCKFFIKNSLFVISMRLFENVEIFEILSAFSEKEKESAQNHATMVHTNTRIAVKPNRKVGCYVSIGFSFQYAILHRVKIKHYTLENRTILYIVTKSMNCLPAYQLKMFYSCIIMYVFTMFMVLDRVIEFQKFLQRLESNQIKSKHGWQHNPALKSNIPTWQ